MYQKLNNKVPTDPNHGMSELVPQALGHLTDEDMEFFNKWSKMSSLESGEARKGSKLKNLWCMTPAQRELQGQAIADLKPSGDEGEYLQYYFFFTEKISILYSLNFLKQIKKYLSSKLCI